MARKIRATLRIPDRLLVEGTKLCYGIKIHLTEEEAEKIINRLREQLHSLSKLG